jgi:hypothetical protein
MVMKRVLLAAAMIAPAIVVLVAWTAWNDGK